MASDETTDWRTLVFNVFNLFFLLVGAVNLLTFFYEVHMGSHYINLFFSEIFFLSLYILLAISGLTLFTSILGLLATRLKQCILLYIYILLILLIIVCDLAIVTTTYILSTNLDPILVQELNRTFILEYKSIYDKSISIDFVQENERCCGVVSYSDWRSSNWLQSDLVENLVPDSCCISVLPNCGVRVHPSNIYIHGCLPIAQEKLEHFLKILLSVSVGSTIVPFFGLAFGIALYIFYRKLCKDREEEAENLTPPIVDWYKL